MDVFGSTTKKTREGASAYATSFYSVITFNFRKKGRELILLQLLIKSTAPLHPKLQKILVGRIRHYPFLP